jgi:hypothetical protein
VQPPSVPPPPPEAPARPSTDAGIPYKTCDRSITIPK